MAPQWKFYPEVGNPEIVSPERWAWVALYSDGSILQQFDYNMVYHQFREIDQSRLIAFQMVSMNGAKPPIIMHWKSGRKLIHFYRNIRLNIGTPSETEVRIYCFGYETPTDKMIIAIMPDDQIRVVESIDDIPIA